MNATKIRGLSVRDVRFPSDHQHPETLKRDMDPVPEHCCAYVILYTDSDLKGHGLTFATGGGNELVVRTIKSFSHLLVGKALTNLFSDFSKTLKYFKQETRQRAMGPEKGLIHLAMAALSNALFDLWSRLNHKPLWSFLAEMEPEQLASIVDYDYINTGFVLVGTSSVAKQNKVCYCNCMLRSTRTKPVLPLNKDSKENNDVLTKDEVIQMLTESSKGKESRISELQHKGYPAYISTSGIFCNLCSEDAITDMCRTLLIEGWKHFKVKFTDTLEKDIESCKLINKVIGNTNSVIIDANQSFDVNEVTEIIDKLQEIQPLWIEEPTHADDVLGDVSIKGTLNSAGMKIAAGKFTRSRVMFKQMFLSHAMDVCQVDICKLGGIPEALAVYCMAKKFGVPVCPNAGGIGQGEMALQLLIWDFVSLSGQMEGRFIECADHFTHHLKFPKKISRGHYLMPTTVGNGSEMWAKAVADYEYPLGPAWRDLFSKGHYKDPELNRTPCVATISSSDNIINLR